MAEALLKRFSIESYCPLFKERHGAEVRDGVLFPRYVFAREIEQQFYDVRCIAGVSDILLSAGAVAHIDDAEVSRLKAREDRAGFIWLKTPKSEKFHSGQFVRVTAGPFSGLNGVVKGMRSAERVGVLLSMLKSQRKVTLPLSDLEAA